MTEPRRFPFGGCRSITPNPLSKVEAARAVPCASGRLPGLMDLLARTGRPCLDYRHAGMGRRLCWQRVH